MTTPFWCLLIVLFIPYVLAGTSGYFRSRQLGSIDNNNPRAQQAQLEGAGARLMAAQANAWEAVPGFGFAVIVAHVTGADAAAAALTSMVFVGARVVHAVFYVADLAILRSLTFLVAVICVVRLFLLAP